MNLTDGYIASKEKIIHGKPNVFIFVVDKLG